MMFNSWSSDNQWRDLASYYSWRYDGLVKDSGLAILTTSYLHVNEPGSWFLVSKYDLLLWYYQMHFILYDEIL